MSMTPEEFVKLYRNLKATERASAQTWFNDLCDLLEVPRPISLKSNSGDYGYEKTVSKLAGGRGFVDVWLSGSFGWEFKRKGRNLLDALVQLTAYRNDINNPPLLIVSDIDRIEIHTNFTGTQKAVEVFELKDLLDDKKRLRLRQAWEDPHVFDPSQTRAILTTGAVEELMTVSKVLKEEGQSADYVAHFLVRCVFTLFAERTEILPHRVFTKLLESAEKLPASQMPAAFQEMCGQLFELMQTGGMSFIGPIPHINGGVFTDPTAPPMSSKGLQLLQRAASQEWSLLEPSIFGTLFENIIDPDKRGDGGIHYTPLADILDVLLPTVMNPLRAEWDDLRVSLEPLAEEIEKAREGGAEVGLFVSGGLGESLIDEAVNKLKAFRQRLMDVRALDAAMGSGNFLFVLQRLMLDLEAEVRATIRTLNREDVAPGILPHQFLGIEVNPYAHEIASMVLWIGYLQWLREHGLKMTRTPVLESLPGLENRDAVLTITTDPTTNVKTAQAACWPQAEFIIGNPPFIGDKALRRALGDDYVKLLHETYKGSVPANADFVTYWLEKARAAVEAKTTKRAGFVTTQSVRAGGSREVLERIQDTASIFMAWSNRPWTSDGAAVRVSIVAFDDRTEKTRTLDGNIVPNITASLTTGEDAKAAIPLRANKNLAFQGPVKVGSFEVEGAVAAIWLAAGNPSGKPNRDVLKPWINGKDITDRPVGRWIVDFDVMKEDEAKDYRLPYKHVEAKVKPDRLKNKDKQRRDNWWRLGRSGSDLKAASAGLSRILVTPRVSTYRIWAWVPADTLPDSRVLAVTRDDDFTFGVLHSRVHEVWSLANSSSHGVGNDPTYVTETCFDPFPFPEPDATQRANIELYAEHLDAERNKLLAADPTLTMRELYHRVKEQRIVRNMAASAYQILSAHEDLDEAVFVAYGWSPTLTDAEIIFHLLQLNAERAAAEAVEAAAAAEAAALQHEADKQERLKQREAAAAAKREQKAEAAQQRRVNKTAQQAAGKPAKAPKAKAPKAVVAVPVEAIPGEENPT
ncbi:class I SAM-dependent DNA methyltransferase [Deinococcus sp. 6YEL10]|uniref:class I SAM-dependent DNA methyltransferase n=1 Tax=Deinococcus sp. 6YEL10 TaxID=2745870 RepID=UPI001E4ABD66|nr:DNA methyltransferase [Deinococcus sp. 6YEL10]MCD0161093.1 class I SAM-dependent DNA methyltransferase [Deinococcus sp. 6YEL10]